MIYTRYSLTGSRTHNPMLVALRRRLVRAHFNPVELDGSAGAAKRSSMHGEIPRISTSRRATSDEQPRAAPASDPNRYNRLTAQSSTSPSSRSGS